MVILWRARVFVGKYMPMALKTIDKTAMILELFGKSEWNAILTKIENYDCYHTYEYHNISKNPEETPLLLVYESPGATVALPLLLRCIQGTDFFDCTSVYGYSGPIYSKGTSLKDLHQFQRGLEKYLKKKGIVSVFSRLNPFIEGQDRAIDGLGQIEELGPIVNIDLKQEEAYQRQLFSKTTKRYLNRARRLLYVEKSNLFEDLETFIALYYENMKRVRAKDIYFFDRDYFSRIVDSKDFKTEVYSARLKDSDQMVSAIMIFKSKKGVHYHISGTKSEYLYLSPMRLLIDNVRLSVAGSDLGFFNLGGGIGSKKDNLFYFKSSFSKDYNKFKVWKYVVDREKYKLLAGKSGKTVEGFFPAYRN